VQVGATYFAHTPFLGILGAKICHFRVKYVQNNQKTPLV
jgi:hypothetical protein